MFESWGMETPSKYTKAEIESILNELEDKDRFGFVLRAKGMLPSSESEQFIHFDYVPGEAEVRDGAAEYTGKVCVIGSDLKKENIIALFKS